MKPIKFPEQNCTYAADKPYYQSLPAYVTKDGVAISCWSLTWRERLYVLFTGKMWFSVHTFNDVLQPQLPSVYKPSMRRVPIIDKGE